MIIGGIYNGIKFYWKEKPIKTETKLILGTYPLNYNYKGMSQL